LRIGVAVLVVLMLAVVLPAAAGLRPRTATKARRAAPNPRWGAPMAFDPADHVMLRFGGLGGTGARYTSPLLGDTWWYNGTWTNRTSA
jgi:hypothetical protein